MANYKVTDSELISIADAIRSKGGTSASLAFPSGFVSAISAISGGGVTPTYGSKTILENGEYDPATDGFDAFSHVTVSVPTSGSSPVLVSKTISENGIYNPADDNADAFSQVVVSVEGGGSGGRSLPSEYQAVEYIETDGSAYCSINFRLMPYDEIIFDAYVLPDSPNDEQGIIGYNSKPYWEIYYESVAFYFYSKVVASSVYAEKGVWTSIVCSMSSNTGETLPQYESFFRVGKYSPQSYPFYGRLKDIIIKERRKYEVCHLIPCYRVSDSIIGYYDVINSAFYSNAGSGAFGKGSDI